MNLLHRSNLQVPTLLALTALAGAHLPPAPLQSSQDPVRVNTKPSDTQQDPAASHEAKRTLFRQLRELREEVKAEYEATTKQFEQLERLRGASLATENWKHGMGVRIDVQVPNHAGRLELYKQVEQTEQAAEIRTELNAPIPPPERVIEVSGTLLLGNPGKVSDGVAKLQKFSAETKQGFQCVVRNLRDVGASLAPWKDIKTFGTVQSIDAVATDTTPPPPLFSEPIDPVQSMYKLLIRKGGITVDGSRGHSEVVINVKEEIDPKHLATGASVGSGTDKAGNGCSYSNPWDLPPVQKEKLTFEFWGRFSLPAKSSSSPTFQELIASPEKPSILQDKYDMFVRYTGVDISDAADGKLRELKIEDLRQARGSAMDSLSSIREDRVRALTLTNLAQTYQGFYLYTQAVMAEEFRMIGALQLVAATGGEHVRSEIDRRKANVASIRQTYLQDAVPGQK